VVLRVGMKKAGGGRGGLGPMTFDSEQFGLPQGLADCPAAG